MDDHNITIEEYIRLEEEKARRNAIVFDDAFTSEVTPSYESTASPLNDNKVDFRISFDESDNKDYTIVYDKNSFSYKIISVNDLKTDSKNDNDKVNMPSFPSPEPEISYYNDLDFFKDFEKEFPAIVYNDALTSKSDFSTEPTLFPQHIDEFKSKDDTSLSEYTNNDNGKIDIDQPSVIKKSLVKMKQKGAILELKRRHVKNIIFCYYTPYPAMKIWHIGSSSAQETRNDQFPVRRITL
nr:hypothetical protein [Tanacetum cinerariifolium]